MMFIHELLIHVIYAQPNAVNRRASIKSDSATEFYVTKVYLFLVRIRRFFLTLNTINV